ncbi:MAG: DUF4271 domain-containing protein [Prevotella sp.]|nr:DUF4271 domain-containing protein [Prevotella sp.]
MRLTQTDTIPHIIGMEEDGLQTTTLAKPVKKKTPADVLRSLPQDASPAQQDSAIQANFKPGKRIYNTRVDTVGLPGKAVSPWQQAYGSTRYKDSYFFSDSLLALQSGTDRFGVAADPVPYTLRNDNVITALLLICFIIATISFSKSRRFIVRQAKNFFYTQRRRSTFVAETAGEIRFQIFLIAQTSLLFAIIFFFYTLQYVADTFILSSQYEMLAIYFAAGLGYFLLKTILYSVVNWVFFDSKSNKDWLKSQLFMGGMEGLLLFPLVLLVVYFDLPLRSAIIYIAMTVGVFKLLSFYKCYITFFGRIGHILQIILYFCALEIVPLAFFYGSLVWINDSLKINY